EGPAEVAEAEPPGDGAGPGPAIAGERGPERQADDRQEQGRRRGRMHAGQLLEEVALEHPRAALVEDGAVGAVARIAHGLPSQPGAAEAAPAGRAAGSRKRGSMARSSSRTAPAAAMRSAWVWPEVTKKRRRASFSSTAG